MAKFVYRMQNILNIKLKLESQAKIAYSNANRALQEEQEVLQHLMLRRMEYEKKLKALMEGSINISEINHARADVNSMKNLIRKQLMAVRKAEILVEEARRNLNSVMQERKTYEKLKEKDFESFKKELLYEESKEIDQLVSYSYNDR